MSPFECLERSKRVPCSESERAAINLYALRSFWLAQRDHVATGDDEEDWRGSGALKSLPGTDDKWRDTQRGIFTVTRPPSRGVNQPSPGYFAYKDNFPHHEREQDRMADEVRTALERRLIPC